jgi:hypothetical protein
LSVIHRCPKTRYQDGDAGPVRFQTDDAFCLDGERLAFFEDLDGEIEYRTEQRRHREGIPIEDATWRRLGEVAARFGISAPRSMPPASAP